MNVEKAHLAKVPYIANDAVGHGRVVNLMPFWDGQHWTIWFPTPGGLVEHFPTDVVCADYVAKAPANPGDIVVPFIEFMWQRACWNDTVELVSRTAADIHAMACSLAKFDHFFATRKSAGVSTRFVETELEYMLIVARSLFDLLQKIVATLWQRHVILLDPAQQKSKRSLPESFTRLVLESRTEVRSQERIAERYGIPAAVAATYAEIAPYYRNILVARDGIIHHGQELPIIFDTESGYCVDKTQSPYCLFDVWTPAHVYNQNLVSLRPLVAHVLFTAIDSAWALMSSLSNVIRFPEPLAPGYRVFSRTQHNDALLTALRVTKGELAWWGPSPNAVTSAQ